MRNELLVLMFAILAFIGMSSYANARSEAAYIQNAHLVGNTNITVYCVEGYEYVMFRNSNSVGVTLSGKNDCE